MITSAQLRRHYQDSFRPDYREPEQEGGRNEEGRMQNAEEESVTGTTKFHSVREEQFQLHQAGSTRECQGEVAITWRIAAAGQPLLTVAPPPF
jgi:hypothetical protein